MNFELSTQQCFVRHISPVLFMIKSNFEFNMFRQSVSVMYLNICRFICVRIKRNELAVFIHFSVGGCAYYGTLKHLPLCETSMTLPHQLQATFILERLPKETPGKDQVYKGGSCFIRTR